MPKELDWGYVTGFFDGEGCVYIPLGSNGIGSARLIFSQKLPEVLFEIQRFLTTNGVSSTVKARSKGMHELSIFGRDNLEKVIPKLLSRSVTKQIKLLDLWRFLRCFPSLAGRMPKGMRLRNEEGQFQSCQKN